MSTRYAHTLTLAFESDFELPTYEGPIYAPSTLEPDEVTVSKEAITFSFERSSRLRAERALNNATRQDQIRRAMLFIIATSSYTPRVSFIEYHDRVETQRLELPPAMRGWHDGASTPVVRAGVAACVFANTPLDKAVARALSYVCAGKRMSALASQNDRFRYVWGAFNALYSYLSPGERLENRKIERVRQYLEDECDTAALMERYALCDNEMMLKELNYYAFLKNRLITRNGELRPDWRVLIECMDGLLLANSKGVFAKLVKEESQPKAEFNAIRQRTPKDKLKQILFLVCAYAYGLRNAFFHGESYYPLFPVGEDVLLELTADLVELACVSIIERLVQDRS